MSGQDAELTAGRADAKERVFAIASIITLVIVPMTSAVVFYGTFRAPRVFETMFIEMGVKLPLLTQLVLSPAFYMILPLLAIASIIKEVLVRNRVITLVINGVHICLVILVGTTCQLALFLPLIDLMEKMGEA